MRSIRGPGEQPRQVDRPASGTTTTDLPLLPLFNAVLLPGGVVRVTIPAGWRKSTALVELLLQQQGGEVLVAAVPYLTAGGAGGRAASAAAAVGGSGGDDEGGSDDHLDLDRLHHTGTAARVLQLVRRTQSGGWTVALEGRCRLRVRSVHLSSLPPQQHYEAGVEQLDYFAGPVAPASSAAVSPAAAKEQEELAQQLLKGTRRLFVLIQGEAEGREAAARVARALAQQGPTRMADVLGSLVARALPDRLALLAELDVTARMHAVLRLLDAMLEAAERAAGNAATRGRFRRAGRAGGSRSLRLPPGLAGGAAADEQDEEEEEEGEESRRELLALMDKLKRAAPPPEVLRAAQREFKRLQRGSDAHPGYLMSLNYLESLAELPWSRHSGQAPQQAPPAEEGGSAGADPPAGPLAPPLAPLPLDAVRRRLDEAHYGLDKVKERIVQYVAVQRLRGWDARAPILCFIGPPGVGKTSLARSIAEVLGRPFQRISLGGVRDEAEIRGHRRTYIGAMPGRLIQAVRKAGVRDPLLLLDEVDKMGRDAARGDPAAALLEVLDPEQNSSFVDTYLGLPFDLSACLFVATANRAADIPAPLLDRLEVVQLGGYTREEKVHIAERHLIPRLLSEHGLGARQLAFPPAAVRAVIEGWTREAGVRSLARSLAAVCRHVAVQVVQQREREGEGGGAADEEREARARERPPLEPLALPEPLEQAHAQRGAEPGPHQAAAAGRGPAGRPPFPQRRLSLPQPGSQGPNGRRGAPLGGTSGGLLLQKPVPGRMAGMRLWAELAPLAINAGDSGVVGAVFGGVPATGGYPWPQLRSPRGRGGVQLAAGPGGAADCTCPHRKHQGWFSWLRWPWHDGAAGEGAAGPQQQQQQQQHEAGAAAGAHCSCEGRCSDHDCCCAPQAGSHSGSAGEQQEPRPLPAAAEGWSHQDGGVAAESVGWEQSWRQAAARRAAAQADPPRLCGPGSMQILRRPPQPARQAAAVAAPAHRLASGFAGPPLALAEPEQLPGALDGGGGRPCAQLVVDEALLEAVLGPPRFEGHSAAERVAAPGTAAGLVWTAAGGKVQYIECICVGAAPAGGAGGRVGGQLTLTGQLGEVLEESARIALSWVRAHAPALGLPGDASCPSRKWDVHIHLPAGAVPKDGPSAGITLAVALVSLFTERCVRPDVAMTGELTLRGLVLPVGGIKEKLLAAHAAGMAKVLVPARNMPDVQADVPPELRQALEVVPCQRLEDILAAAFDPPLVLKQTPLLARL